MIRDGFIVLCIVADCTDACGDPVALRLIRHGLRQARGGRSQ